MNRIAVCFIKVPPGTHYRAGAWSWVYGPKATSYIQSGYGIEWNPDTNEPTDPKYRPWDEHREKFITNPRPVRIEPLYIPVPVSDLTHSHLWRQIFVSMKKEGYKVTEKMTKAEMLKLR